MATPPFPETNGEEGEAHLHDLIGRNLANVGTGFVGVLHLRPASQTEIRQGHDFDGNIYYLDSGTTTQILSGRGGFSLMDSMRNITNVTSKGAISSGGKASETDLDRLFPGMAEAGGAGGAGRTASEQALDVARATEALASAQAMGDQTAINQAAQALDEAKFAWQQFADQQGWDQWQQDHDLNVAMLDLDAQRLQWEKDRFEKEQIYLDERAKADRLHQIELLEMQLDNSRRELAYSEYGATGRQKMQEKAQEREWLWETAGEDPWRAAFSSVGQETPGLTPVDVQKARGQAFVNQPMPQVSLSDPLEDIEAATALVSGMQSPQGGMFGMAQGGIVEMGQGGDGVFRMSSPTSFLVGDGGGIIPGVTEVLTIGNGKVQVTPLGGGAQAGLTASDYSPTKFDPFTPDFDIATISQAPFLQRARRGAGIGAAALDQFRIHNLLAPTPDYLPYKRFRLLAGNQPGAQREWKENLLRKHRAYKEGPMGRIRHGTFASLGYAAPWAKPAPIGGEAPGFQARGPITIERGVFEAGIASGLSEDDAAKRAIFMSQKVGPLPAPHKIARTFMSLSPDDQNMLLGLYKYAGVSPTSFIDTVKEATIFGREGGGGRIGGLGTRL